MNFDDELDSLRDIPKVNVLAPVILMVTFSLLLWVAFGLKFLVLYVVCIGLLVLGVLLYVCLEELISDMKNYLKRQ